MKKLFLLSALSLLILFQACKKDDVDDDQDQNPNLDYGLGLNPDENLDTVPTAVNFGFGDGNLPSKYDITDKFPPIGDQGNYGTCVTWTIGYNAQSAMNGMEKNFTQTDLVDPKNQFSPKDLFVSLSDTYKSPNCVGSNFAGAYNHLQGRGIATMETVPYENLGNCSQSNADPSWDSEASKNKIKYWRTIDASVQSIKRNISNNIPVAAGAKLSDNFMTWNSENVISSNTTYNQVGQHAYHAVTVAGYDDSKGANGAFRIINSWGPQWGDAGYIWIDYNFFINEFISSGGGTPSLFIAETLSGNNTVPDENTNPTDDGVDLAPWVFNEYSTFPNSGIENERIIDFNVYNIGSQDAMPSSEFEMYYIYYNAYDANDYGILFYDQFNQTIESETYECPTADNCIINTSIEAGNNMANKMFGTLSIERTYYVPQITGEYYFLLIADATNVFQEEDELDNFFYTTLYPVYIDNGFAVQPKSSDSKLISNNELRLGGADSRSSKKFNSSHKTNSYTPEEIASLIKVEKKSGRFEQKLNRFKKGENKIYHSKHSH